MGGSIYLFSFETPANYRGYGSPSEGHDGVSIGFRPALYFGKPIIIEPSISEPIEPNWGPEK